jgi:hypothetical protein
MDEIKIISLVLYKKYSKVYNWLSYNDLHLIVLKIKKKYRNVSTEFNKDLNGGVIKHFDKKLFPLLEKIEENKCLRNYEDNKINKEEKELEIIEIESKEKEKTYFTETNVPMKESLGLKSYCLLVDSYDRNKSAWEEINPFSFPMGYKLSIQNEYEKSDKSAEFYGGSVPKTFSNVDSLTITKIILPKYDINDNDISEKYPYIIFIINEIENKMNGTNNNLNSSFDQLVCPSKYGNFLHYNYTKEEVDMEYKFMPRIEISKLTFSFKTPTGELINFGKDDDNEYLRIVVGLNIKCLTKSLTTQYINRPV